MKNAWVTGSNTDLGEGLSCMYSHQSAASLLQHLQVESNFSTGILKIFLMNAHEKKESRVGVYMSSCLKDCFQI